LGTPRDRLAALRRELLLLNALTDHRPLGSDDDDDSDDYSDSDDYDPRFSP
jgi:hypothetical protein